AGNYRRQLAPERRPGAPVNTEEGFGWQLVLQSLQVRAGPAQLLYFPVNHQPFRQRFIQNGVHHRTREVRLQLIGIGADAAGTQEAEQQLLLPAEQGITECFNNIHGQSLVTGSALQQGAEFTLAAPQLKRLCVSGNVAEVSFLPCRPLLLLPHSVMWWRGFVA